MPAGQAALSQDWLRGESGLAIAPMSAPWPDRCVKCNAPAEGYRLKQSLYWHPAWLYVLILPGVLVYAVVALVIRKSYVGHVGLCPSHRSRRRWILGAGAFLAISSVASCSAGFGSNPGVSLGLGVFGGIAGMVIVQVATFAVRPKKITEAYAWLKCGKAFVASLPAASIPSTAQVPAPGIPYGSGHPAEPPDGMPG